MERHENWYSIIQYMPNQLRGEVINIGLLLHDPENGSLRYKILDESNKKVKSLLGKDYLNEAYKVNKDYIDYYLENLPSEDTLFDKSVNSNSFIENLKERLPDGFLLSDPVFSKTSNPDILFDGLLRNYIGEEFLNLNDNISHTTTKKYVSEFFDSRKLLGRKIKPNVKLRPIEHISQMQFTIDFVYKNGVINLLQAVPSNKDRLNEWFSKIHTISESYQTDAGIYLLYNKNSSTEYDDTLNDMLSYFRSHDERIVTLDIKSKDLSILGNKIEDEGRYVDEFEKELA